MPFDDRERSSRGGRRGKSNLLRVTGLWEGRRGILSGGTKADDALAAIEEAAKKSDTEKVRFLVMENQFARGRTDPTHTILVAPDEGERGGRPGYRGRNDGEEQEERDNREGEERPARRSSRRAPVRKKGGRK